MYVLPRLFPRKNVPAKEPCIPMATAGPVYKLHGSFVIFTPLFFKFFDGFDPNTFLFGEETILAEMLRQKNLLAFFQPALNVVHKEDVSTNIYLKGRDKLKFFLKHQYDSYRHLTRAYLCCYEQ
jgi:GT2 family glycosyltransferase